MALKSAFLRFVVVVAVLSVVVVDVFVVDVAADFFSWAYHYVRKYV